MLRKSIKKRLQTEIYKEMTVQDDKTLWVLKEGEETIEQATNRLISTINYRIDVDPLVDRLKLLEQSRKVTTAIENLNVSVIGRWSAGS